MSNETKFKWGLGFTCSQGSIKAGLMLSGLSELRGIAEMVGSDGIRRRSSLPLIKYHCSNRLQYYIRLSCVTITSTLEEMNKSCRHNSVVTFLPYLVRSTIFASRIESKISKTSVLRLTIFEIKCKTLMMTIMLNKNCR